MDEDTKEIELKPNEIFSFNLWIVLSLGYLFYMLLCLLSQNEFPT